jgi:hypothetical protein
MPTKKRRLIADEYDVHAARVRKIANYEKRKERKAIDDEIEGLDAELFEALPSGSGPEHDALTSLGYSMAVLNKALLDCPANECPASLGRIYAIDTLDEQHVLKWCSSDVGLKNVQCQRCNAFMFAGECCNQKEVDNGKPHRFMMCCSDGIVDVPRCSQPSSEFEDLVTKSLSDELPRLNALMAFVGVNAFKAENSGKQYSYKILGNFDRIMCTNLLASPTFAGIYIYDADQQLQMRESLQSNYEAANRIKHEHISFVTNYLMDNNPFAVTLRLGAADQHTPIELLSGLLYTLKKPASKGGEVAALYPGDGVSRPHFGVATLKGGSIADAPSIILGFDSQQSDTQSIRYDHASYDALRFPVLFPHGIMGWHRAMKSNDATSLKRVSVRQYYSFMLQDRPHTSHFLLSGKRLLQEYIVDAGCKIEDSELQFQKNNQEQLRADKYSNIKAAKDADCSGTLGHSKPTVLNKSFRNSPAQKAAKYKDFMAAFIHHGGVDAFITMTANPNWPEVQAALPKGMLAEDRPDIVCRVFRLKLAILKQQLTQGILGQTVCIGYVIEFQKRGLPHAHIAVSFAEKDKLKSSRDVDLMISAEIPDPVKCPILHKMVCRHHVHCCKNDPGDPGSCMLDGCCKKSFPFDERQTTVLVDSSYPLYRRRNMHPTVITKSGQKIRVTDGMIVPYNPALLLLLDCHCNIQACSQIFDYKYMFKYFTKSPEMSIFYPHDEARTNKMRANYLNFKQQLHPDDAIGGYKIARFLGTSDCIWSIFSFELYYLSQSVQALDLHLPDNQEVFLRDNQLIGKAERTMLTSFFELNEFLGEDPLFLNPTLQIKDLLYEELPQFCVWDVSTKMWNQRCRAVNQVTIGRLHKPADSQPELFSLRLLLQKVKGPKSFKELYNGATTFVQAAGAVGLLSDDAEFEHYMREVIDIEVPVKCRYIFADLLMSVAVPHPVNLWAQLQDLMSKDYQYKIRASVGKYPPDMCNKHALWCINERLVAHGTNLLNYGFSTSSYNLSPVLADSKTVKYAQVICTEMSDYIGDEKNQLNELQKLFFETVERCSKSDVPQYFILQAPGGTGKTFTMNLLIKYFLHAKKKIAVTSSTGISATALIGGRTIHSALNAGILTPDLGDAFNIGAQSNLAAEWRSIDVLIIDEVMCLHKNFLEAVAVTLQRNIFIDHPHRLAMGPFCGLHIILTGDPRQQLPITPHATRSTIVASSLHCSELFKLFTVCKLTENVRIHRSINCLHDDGRLQPLQEWILNVGDGKIQAGDLMVDGSHFVRMPPQFYCGDSLSELIDRIYGSFNSANSEDLSKRIILTSLYKDVRLINHIMIERFRSLRVPIISVQSHDTVTGKYGDIEDANAYSASRFPEHNLQLFIGCPVICLRAFNRQLNNGDRGIIESISLYRLGIKMITGKCAGSIVHLPRTRFTPATKSMKIEMTRLQFGVAVAFAMTVSKSQSCGFKHVGIWLNDHLFAHGQLYLALSRIQVQMDGEYTLLFASRDNIMIDERGIYARNLVYNEVLHAYGIKNE